MSDSGYYQTTNEFQHKTRKKGYSPEKKIARWITAMRPVTISVRPWAPGELNLATLTRSTYIPGSFYFVPRIKRLYWCYLSGRDDIIIIIIIIIIVIIIIDHFLVV